MGGALDPLPVSLMPPLINHMITMSLSSSSFPLSLFLVPSPSQEPESSGLCRHSGRGERRVGENLLSAIFV